MPSKQLVATPKWALAQLESICLRAQVDLPLLHWYRSQEDVGSYDSLPARIGVCETYEEDHRTAAEITLLHEIAHHLARQIAHTRGHCPAFWEICWRLYLDQGVPLDQAVYGEFSYHAGAEKALRALQIDLSARVEAAGAYGTACRRLDHLEAKIQRFSPKPHLQSYLDDLRAQEAQAQAESRLYLQQWRSAS